MDPDRIKGMLIGHALGDALGAPHEFRLKDPPKYTGFLEYPIRRFNRYLNKCEEYGPIGSATDDTEMAHSLFAHLSTNNWKIDVESLVLRYLAFANHSRFLGRNTRELFKGVTTYAGYVRRFKKRFSDPEIAKSAQSNGALMRCAPLALCPNWHRQMRIDCNLTNPSTVARNTEQIYLAILGAILTGQTADSVLKWLTSLLQKNKGNKSPVLEAVFEALGMSGGGMKRDLIANKGWCCHALYCVVLALKSHWDYPTAMREVITMGGDTDTNACIVGAVIGALYGYTALCSDSTTKKNLNILMKVNLDLLGDYTNIKEIVQ